ARQAQAAGALKAGTGDGRTLQGRPFKAPQRKMPPIGRHFSWAGTAAESAAHALLQRIDQLGDRTLVALHAHFAGAAAAWVHGDLHRMRGGVGAGLALVVMEHATEEA